MRAGGPAIGRFEGKGPLNQLFLDDAERLLSAGCKLVFAKIGEVGEFLQSAQATYR